MVTVLVVSDEEVPGFESRLDSLDVDLLLSAGDLPWGYLEELAGALDVPAVFVPGNHDPATRGGQGPVGFLDLDGRVAEVGGLRVEGLGGCVRYNRGEHQYTQDEHVQRAAALLVAAEPAVDVLLTHAPPQGLGDQSDPAHAGIKVLHDVLAVLTPTWHLHGHIHPHGMARPDRQVGRTTVRNVIPWHVLDIVPRGSETGSDEAGED